MALAGTEGARLTSTFPGRPVMQAFELGRHSLPVLQTGTNFLNAAKPRCTIQELPGLSYKVAQVGYALAHTPGDMIWTFLQTFVAYPAKRLLVIEKHARDGRGRKVLSAQRTGALGRLVTKD